jgi:hypothetical protein
MRLDDATHILAQLGLLLQEVVVFVLTSFPPMFSVYLIVRHSPRCSSFTSLFVSLFIICHSSYCLLFLVCRLMFVFHLVISHSPCCSPFIAHCSSRTVRHCSPLTSAGSCSYWPGPTGSCSRCSHAGWFWPLPVLPSPSFVSSSDT